MLTEVSVVHWLEVILVLALIRGHLAEAGQVAVEALHIAGLVGVKHVEQFVQFRIC